MKSSQRPRRACETARRTLYKKPALLRIHNSMNRIARLIGIALLLLIIFLAAVLASWTRLRRQTDQVQKTTIEIRQHQLERALSSTRPPPLPWPESYIKDLNTLLDAQVEVRAKTEPSSANPTSSPWYFDYTWRGADREPLANLHVTIKPPATVQLGHLYRHTSFVLLALALGLLIVLVIVILFSREENSAADQPIAAGSNTSHGFASLSQLAKVSVQQQAELEHERIERLRADEDLHFQQLLLNRSLEEKIQLGRELHDGIIQSLYATGLTFEAAKKHIASSPEEASRQLEAGLKTLNTTIRDVRSYISGLAPENLRQQSFSQAVLSLTQTLGSGRAVNFDLRIDEQTAGRLNDTQVSNLLQIIRESISNSLRHGAATQITVRLHESADEIGLLIQDNGKGFDPARLVARGHGLDNIKARTDRINAGLRIASAPGEGTRLVITLPISLGHVS
ncbi:MAG: sensor histidine kinase [Nibricoccus sp.]